MNISVIIPAYKQTEMLIRNLRHNLRFFNKCEVIVVNDYPSEPLTTFREEFPQVKFIENIKNVGFGRTVNNGVSKASHDLIFLLNSDVVLTDDSFKQVDRKFVDPHLFGVSFAQIEKKDEIVGKNKIFWKKGLFLHSKAFPMTSGINGWAEGGASILRKSQFLELKGFDPLYSPFYWEDIDLSYRAWKNGYKVQFDDTVRVEHHHESTIGSNFSRKHIQSIAYRNQFIFIWKNITDLSLILSHIIVLPKLLIKAVLERDSVLLKGFIEALKMIPQIWIARLSLKHSYSDHAILRKFS
jgi:GT2 family glycosyltransferase